MVNLLTWPKCRFADPACDACIAALGTLGCIACVKNDELWTALGDELSPLQPRIVASLQSQYCQTPKRPAPIFQKASNTTGAAAGKQTATA